MRLKRKKREPEEGPEYKEQRDNKWFLVGIALVSGFTFAGIGIVAAGGEVMMLFALELVLIMTFGVLTMLFTLKTNAWSELIASMRGTPLIKLYRRDRTVQSVVCKMKAGMANTRNEGAYIITPDSVFRDKKTGLPVLSAFSDYGVSINPKMPMVGTKLKEEGIEDFTIAEEVTKNLAKDGKRLSIPIPYMETVKWDDIIGFFKYNINPHYIQAAVERRVTLGLQGVRSIPYGWISAMGVLLGFIAIAYVIIMSGVPQNFVANTASAASGGIPLIG